MLASVSNLDEALLVVNTAVNIIDLKQPKLGSLGALPIKTVKKIVQAIKPTKPISATVGDLPMQPKLIFDAVATMAETGVNYIKIGFFPGGDWQKCWLKLAQITQKTRLIAVLFADTQPDISIIKALKNAGFSGVMLDTMDKSKGSLLQVMNIQNIKKFVDTTNNFKLLCGLAGSLKKPDIFSLISLKKVDYLGFRGALCKKQCRQLSLDINSINSILADFKSAQSLVI